MKFGRYLSENLTPEWKRAYIDYRACKKAIKVVAARLEDKPDAPGHGAQGPAGVPGARDGDHDIASSGDDDDEDTGPSRRMSISPRVKTASIKNTPSTRGSRTPGNLIPHAGRGGRYGSTGTSPRPIHKRSEVPPPLDLGESSYPEGSTLEASKGLGGASFAQSPTTLPWTIAQRTEAAEGNATETDGEALPNHSDYASSKNKSSDEGRDETTPLTPNLNRLQSQSAKSPRFAASPRFGTSSRHATPKVGGQDPFPAIGTARRSLRSWTAPSPRPTTMEAPPPATFEELYDTLEEDEKAFFNLLQQELDKVESFYAARIAESQKKLHDLRDQLSVLAEHRKAFHELYPEGLPDWENTVNKIIPGGRAMGFASLTQNLRKRLPFSSEDQQSSKPNGTPATSQADGNEGPNEQAKNKIRQAFDGDAEHQAYSVERYQKYKRDLRNASLDFYRYLELVKNYRIMNLTGFRKALKKFEKTTRIVCMELYTDDMINKRSFAKGKVVDSMIDEMESLFTIHFEHGDTKKARDRLRRQEQNERTHYWSVFRSGIMIGLSLPVIVLALNLANQKETQEKIRGYQGLLQVYGGFYIAVIFALLFQLNLEAYVRARINYEFVMELSQPTIDHRSYAEIPAFLFMTLSYCFFFSFYRVATHSVAPTTWPLAWLVFVIVFFLNPLDILRRSTRYWFLRVLFRVCTPGYSRVEFIAFFIADELNSLVYTIQNIYFIGCAYSHHWPENIYGACPSGSRWPYGLLACLPALARLIQCLKRFHDSRLNIHLINAGKYVSSIIQLWLFMEWRRQGRSLHNAAFITWTIFAIIASIYTSAWDLIVDWSLLRPGAGILRKDRGYSSPYVCFPVYYFAMVTNVTIRFIWIFYIPVPTKHTQMRSFFFSIAEMLRRWQWNFFRVETEHLGNADAYRVTREIPLPYRHLQHDSDEDNEGLTRKASKNKATGFSVRLDKIRRELTGAPVGRGPDALNVGPRGHAREREYEARRHGDSDEEDSGDV